VIAAACGDSGSIATPDGDLIPGLHLAAAVVIIESGWRPVSVQATLTNTSSDPIEISYPAGCPVRMRFYNADDALVYDETTLPCLFTVVTSFTLEPGQARTLTSGAKYSWVISGDSLPRGQYRTAAILRLTGMTPIELEAGTYDLIMTSPPAGVADRN
jgi:hypothetical protein